tara:strand:- start:585 stop:848 length:264 start_codon:yes stop_codon:yes gene_type:complete
MIDTQAMGIPLTPEQRAVKKEYKEPLEALTVSPRRLHTPEEVKELKILIHEVLDEREGKTGVSYFDAEQFAHRVDEPEPPYKQWTRL